MPTRDDKPLPWAVVGYSTLKSVAGLGDEAALFRDRIRELELIVAVLKEAKSSQRKETDGLRRKYDNLLRAVVGLCVTIVIGIALIFTRKMVE